MVFAGLLLFFQDTFMNLFAIDPDIAWRVNAYANLVALDSQYRDCHVVPDDQFFTNPS